MYLKLDELILERIRTGFTTFALIFAGEVKDEVKRLAGLLNEGQPKRDQVEEDRLVDRRLQALRKKRDITYDRKTGWSLARS